MRLKTLKQPEPPIIECIWLNTNDNIEYIKENGEWVPLHHHCHCRHHVDHIIIEDNNSSSSPSDLNMNEIKILINDKINKTEAESLFQPKGNYALKSDLDNIPLPEMPDMFDYVKKEDIKDFSFSKSETYISNITINEITSIQNPENGDKYNVFNSGNEEEGYGTEDFTYNNENYQAGSTMEYKDNHWVVKDSDDKDFKVASFEALQNKLILPFNVNREVAYPNTRNNSYKSGLKLFDAYVYNLTDDGYVREYTTEFGTTSDKWTFKIPFARVYTEGTNDEKNYSNGLLTSDQLQYIYEHTHDWNDITGKPDIPESVTDIVKYVPQTLNNNQKAQARANIGAGTSNFSGNYNDLTEKPTIPDVSDFVDKSNEQWINAVKHFNKKPCIRKESSDDNSTGIWFDDYLHNHIGFLGVSGTSLTNSFPFFSNNKLGVAEIITDKGDQILTGAKTFRNLDSYQLAVSTETSSRYYDEPSIGFYSKGPESYELVGRIGVKRTAWTQGYPAYWEGVGSDPQRLIIENEKGNSYTPIYIDGYGKTKACKSKRSSIIKWNPNNNSFQIEEGTSWISIKSISDRMIQFTIKDVVSVDQYNSFLRGNSIRMFWAVNSTSSGGVQQFQHETIVDVLETRKIDDEHGNITIGFSNAISYEKGTEESYFGIIIDEL